MAENKRTLKGAYRSFVIAGIPGADFDSDFDLAKPLIKVLI